MAWAWALPSDSTARKMDVPGVSLAQEFVVASPGKFWNPGPVGPTFQWLPRLLKGEA